MAVINPPEMKLAKRTSVHWSMEHNPWLLTPPIAEILLVKNGRAIVVFGFLLK